MDGETILGHSVLGWVDLGSGYVEECDSHVKRNNFRECLERDKRCKFCMQVEEAKMGKLDCLMLN